MLGDGLGAFKLLPAFVATILVGWHGLESSNEGGSTMQNFAPGVREVHPKSAQRFLAVGKRSFLSVIDRPPQNGDRLLDVGVCVVPLLDHVRQVELVPPVAMRTIDRDDSAQIESQASCGVFCCTQFKQCLTQRQCHHRHQLPVTVGGDLFAHKKPDRDMRETAGLLPAHWVWRRLRPAPLSISVYSRPGSRERLLQAARLSLPTHSACTALPVTQNW